VECDDTTARFAIFDHEQPPPDEIEMHLAALLKSHSHVTPRQHMPDAEWVGEIVLHLSQLIDLRVNHVKLWLDSNLKRFEGGHAAIEDLRRTFDRLVIEMTANVQLCRAQCASCHLFCVRSRLHEGDHSCQTTHKCIHNCQYCGDSAKLCGSAYVYFLTFVSSQLTMSQRRTSREARVRGVCLLMLLFLISLQLYCQCPSVWRPVQIIGKAWLPKRLHEGRNMRLYFRSILLYSGYGTCRRRAYMLRTRPYVRQSTILPALAGVFAHGCIISSALCP